ncbi:MAG: hypothetical protein PHH26_08190 [Candidatus Thermoplasmatota archaeon]|nr:hypothetical protein [Candidatus Thermoplasmatota archaeon]
MAKKYNTVSQNEIDHEASAAFVSALAGVCYTPATENAALALMDGYKSEAPAENADDTDKRNWALAQIDDITRLRILVNCGTEHMSNVPTAVLVAVAERVTAETAPASAPADESDDYGADDFDDDESDDENND